MTGNQVPSGPPSLSADMSASDVAIREIVQLLSLAAEEERVLARLDRCVAELQAIAAARAVLAGCTETELAEAQAWISRSATTGSAPMLPAAAGGERR